VIHERWNYKFVGKSYLESEKCSQLEGTGQTGGEKNTNYIIQMLFGDMTLIWPKIWNRAGCPTRDSESLVPITVWKFLNRQILLPSKGELIIINLVCSCQIQK